MKWWQTSLVLCTFGFLKEFRPSEPFISPYLNGTWKNFTENQINQEIYPVGTYSTMALTVIVFLLTDWLRYKPIIVLEGICGVITWGILSWGQGITMMKVGQIFYGAFCATEVAYNTYMYAKVEKLYYQKVTSQAKTAVLIGKAGSGFLAQMLVLYSIMDYQDLHFFTVGAMSLATIWSLFLPSVPKSTYFNRSLTETDEDKGNYKNEVSNNEQAVVFLPIPNEDVNVTLNTEIKSKDIETKETLVNYSKDVKADDWITKMGFKHLWNDLKLFMKDTYVIKWSIWWSLSLCGYLQATYYMQLLWQNMINEGDRKVTIYHGFSNCAHSLIVLGYHY